MLSRRDFLKTSTLLALAPTVPGFLARTARGRVVTELGYRHIGVTPPQPESQQTRLL